MCMTYQENEHCLYITAVSSPLVGYIFFLFFLIDSCDSKQWKNLIITLTQYLGV